MVVRKRRDTGKWVSDISYNGERIVTTLKLATTKRQAEKAEVVILNNLYARAYGLEPKPDMLFENFVMDTFLPYSENNKKSYGDDILICRVLVKAFRGKNLRQLTPQIIEELKQELSNTPTKRKQKRSPATVNRILSVLSKIMSLAVDADLIEVNPCRKVRKYRLNNRRVRVLGYEEEKRLLTALKNNPLVRKIVILALNTGLRRGEIFNLKWADVDRERGVIIVQESKSDKKRFVPMNISVRLLLLGISQSNEYVFPSPKTGGKLNQIKRSFRRALKDADIKNFRFHDLRHTFASRLASVGKASAFELMEILGHADIRTTAIYTHANDKGMRDAVAKLDGKNDFCNVFATKQKRQPKGLP
jgi:integrase